MPYLYFATELGATTAQALISTLMGFHGDITTKWSEVRPVTNKVIPIVQNYCIEAPPADFLQTVVGYTLSSVIPIWA